MTDCAIRCKVTPICKTDAKPHLFVRQLQSHLHTSCTCKIDTKPPTHVHVHVFARWMQSHLHMYMYMYLQDGCKATYIYMYLQDRCKATYICKTCDRIDDLAMSENRVTYGKATYLYLSKHVTDYVILMNG